MKKKKKNSQLIEWSKKQLSQGVRGSVGECLLRVCEWLEGEEQGTCVMLLPGVCVTKFAR